MALDYTAVKSIHVGAATLSIALFLLRGAWRFASPRMLALPWVRVVPHIVDTVLLAAGLWLAWQLAAGAKHAWLAAKISGLVVYIVLGTIALKRGRTPAIRLTAFAAAIATFAYVASVALTKSPLGFFGLIH
jgi:uncharacterized membrane protein SirB2